MHVSVFVDTNIFLHYPPMNDIDWCEKCGAESVELVVCMTVIHELDAKKSHPQLSKRAEASIRSIREAKAKGSEIRAGVTLTIFNDEIRASDFPDTLSIDSPDDRIVHLALLYRDRFSKVVLIATSDLGMELRAEARNIGVVLFDEKLRKKSPEDELTRKNKALEQELSNFRNRLPRLRIFISDDGEELEQSYSFKLAQQWPIQSPEQAVAELRAKFPYERKNPHFDTFILAQPSEDEIQRYNKQLDFFYEKYQQHIARANELASLAARTCKFSLWLSNKGRAFASKVNVKLTFPDSAVGIVEPDSDLAKLLSEGLRPPQPPERPKSRLAEFSPLEHNLIARDPSFLNSLRNLSRDVDPEKPVCRVGEFGTDGGRELHLSIESVRHDRTLEIGSFFVVWENHSVEGIFPVQFEISAMEFPERIRNAFTVAVQPSDD